MGRPAGVRSVVAAGLAAAFVIGALPPSSARAESASILLPGRTISALAVDLDGSGGREVLRILDEPGPSLFLDLWRQDGDVWMEDGRLEIPSPTADDPDLAHLATAASLIEVRQPEGRIPLLLVGAVDLGRQFGPTSCCFHAYEVEMHRGIARLRPVDVPSIAADEVLVVDLDGDAVDELIVVSSEMEEASSEAPTRTFSVIRWDGRGYRAAGRTQIEGWSGNEALGDVDGLPGAELTLIDEDGTGLLRLSLRGDVLVTETAEMPLQTWLVGALGRHLVFAGSRPTLYDWPRDGALVPAGQPAGGRGDVIGIVGQGAGALLMTASPTTSGFGLSGAIDIYDDDLRHLGRVEPHPDVAALDAIMSAAAQGRGWELSRSLWPFTGAVDWSDATPDAWMVPGALVWPDGPDGYDTLSVPPLLSFPLGQVGRDDGWVAVCDGCWRQPFRTALSVGVDYAGGQVTISPSAQVFGSSPVAPAVSHPRAIEVGELPEVDATELLASADGFDLAVTLGPGAALVSWDGRSLEDRGVVDGEIRLSVRPPSIDDDAAESRVDAPFEQSLILIGPDGRFEVRSWRGTFAPESPSVEAEMAMHPGSLDVDVSGTASAFATVTVDGRPVAVDADGRFRTTLTAAPWPAAIVVTATDPFGVSAERTVEVIGLVDYRGLPWPAIAVVATVAVAGLLFLRVPHLRGSTPLSGEGTLEELDADSM